jgi:hypothetical protein
MYSLRSKGGNISMEIYLSSKNVSRLAKALERDLQGCPEEAQEWEMDLVDDLRILVEERREFEDEDDDYVYKVITSCRDLISKEKIN